MKKQKMRQLTSRSKIFILKWRIRDFQSCLCPVENQQKVVIGKGLLTKPKILLLDEPSRGIDIGAKTEVFEIIHDLAEKGLSIIVISSELKEIMAIADRICVLSNGKKTGELTGDEITEDTLVRTSYAGLGTGRNA